MKREYYKNYKRILSDESKWRSTIFFGFPKNAVNIENVRELMKKKIFSNEIILTENLIIFQQNFNDKENCKKEFQAARMLQDVIIFAPMSYRCYNVTATAKKIITENKIDEDNFNVNSFISVHEEKLSVETMQKEETISLKLENINVRLDDLQKERNKEIDG